MVLRSINILIMFLLPISVFASSRGYISNGFFLEPVVEVASFPAPFQTSEVTSSAEPQVEVASAPASAAAVETSLRPRPRPAGVTQAAAAAPPVPAGNLALYDMRGCTYSRSNYGSRNCYGSMSTVDRARRIMHAVNSVNRLHGTHFDGRYMLCTGYRESGFNPDAQGAAGEKGMFQVMRGTAQAAIRYGVELSEFKGFSTNDYLARMVNSTLAQVELSFLVLKMKADDAGGNVERRLLNGTGTVDDHWQLARRYNGAGARAERYANKISSCYRCLRDKMSATATNFGSDIQTCLDRAK